MGWDESLRDSLSAVSGLSPGQWCQAFFLFAAISVGTVAAMPRDAKTLLVDYGARKAQKQPEERRGRLISLIATLTSRTQVPHSWFGAFYLMSVALSVFWLAQYVCNGAVLRLIASSQMAVGAPSATLGQVELGWLMLFLQGVRRAFEHATVFRPSKSTMWVVHWLLGLFFYLFISVSVWVEGSAAVLNPTAGSPNGMESLLKMAVATPTFLYAWINQYICHKHLAGLKKYSLPEAGLFRRYICPHYTCECLLYLSMAVATAPRGAWCNRTLLCGLVFVAVNLGVTALGTRKWYAEKFGVDSVANKRNMIPFIF
ncbi:Polyprenol reductase 2 [Madurella mycetomatis]|uniref:Polyprenal reductase n=1 Tax=Madurella mycetomatis TaxID=100816 RepID=A0A175VXW9_9PEZI|nr:Polyprenol reductase 2 [Madurella mycetomatis]